MLKKLALGCLAVVAITGIALFITWRQATRLPDWYQTPSAEPAAGSATVPQPPTAGRAPAGPAPAAASATDSRPGREPTPAPPPSVATAPPLQWNRLAPGFRSPAAGHQRGRVELDEPALNEFLVRSLDQYPRGRRLKRAVKGIRASIDGDRLEVGVVTNLDDLGKAAESEREAKAVRRLAQLAPWLGDRDVYVAVRGRPRVRDGELGLDRDAELKVGGFTFDVADFASRLGVPEEKLDQGVELELSGMTVEDVEVTDGSLILSFGPVP